MTVPRPVGPAFAPALATIHAGAFPPAESWGEDALALQLGLPGAFGLLDEAGGFILARVAADEAEILTLAVAPEVTRRGIGRRLVTAAMAEAARRGARSMFLEVSARNDAAQTLYRGCGFEQVGTRPRYYAGVDALVMRAVISCEAKAG